MFVAPIFLVTSFKNVERARGANQYTGANEKEDLWRVGFTHGFFIDFKLNLFFETEDQAARWSLWEICRPKDIIDPMPLPFFFWDAFPIWSFPKNVYTGVAVKTRAWRSEFVGQNGEYMDLFLPTEGQARRFQKGRAYKVQDVIGTLPSIPAQAAADTEARAQAAKAARDAADAATAAAVTRAQQDTALALQEEANAAAALAAAGDSSGGTLPSSGNSTGGGTPFELGGNQTYLDGSGNLVWVSGGQSGSRDGVFYFHWTITNGGAEGWYSLSAPATGNITFHHYASGTFSPANGQWYGAYFQ